MKERLRNEGKLKRKKEMLTKDAKRERERRGGESEMATRKK